MKNTITYPELVYICGAVGMSNGIKVAEEFTKHGNCYTGVDTKQSENIGGIGLFDKLCKMARNKVSFDDSCVYNVPKATKVISNNPATIIFWEDGSKTVVKCQNGEPFDAEKGIALCYMKKSLGNKYEWYESMKRLMKKAGIDTKVHVDSKAEPVV